jgi:serine/threonine-protein kinase
MSPQQTIAHYRINAKLGEGGMGEVWHATDTKLNREVAIKILPEVFAHDADRMARFQREAQVLASLNHPNIAAIYGVEERALVMELVEGPTLADRIAAGGVPLDEALAIAKQIAEALEYAHEKGIIHRDLKPANVKIKPDGMVKVLDFGLAKMAEQAAVVGSPEESPTVAMGATIAGQILGTAAYMSPEQARGKTVDKRADIWAFGVVLYEMLTGRRMFDGETISDVLAGVLTREPDWEGVPAKARRLLKSCLEKDPKRRLRDIADAWRLLEDTQAAPAAKSGALWKAAAGVLAVSLAIALWSPWGRSAHPIEQPSIRMDIDLGADVSLGSTIGPAVIISPDGKRLVFVSQGQDGKARLFTRLLDEAKAAQLPGTEDAFAPFFSPDGQWVGFFAQGKLKKTRIDGGEPISLCDAPNGRGGGWSEDNSIVASLDPGVGLSQVPLEGGKAVTLTKLNPETGETTHRWPYVLPGGKAAIFVASTQQGGYEDGSIMAVSLKDHRTKMLIDHAGSYPRYLPSGHLIYITNGTLLAVRFDPERLETQGTPTRLEEVSGNRSVGDAQLDLARNGSMVYRKRTENRLTIEWLHADGRLDPAGFDPGFFQMPRLSADGAHLVLIESQGRSADLWAFDLNSHSKTRIINGLSQAFPLLSPDARYLVFQVPSGMHWTRVDGTGSPQPFTKSKSPQVPLAFTPDGARLLYSEMNAEGETDVRLLAVENGPGGPRAGESQLFLKLPTQNDFADFSPDGRWLAYSGAESGRYEVHVLSFPDKVTSLQVSNGGGMMPFWSRTGHELFFYRGDDQRIMAVNYRVKGGSFAADPARVWAPTHLANVGLGLNFALAPNGQRILVLMPAQGPEVQQARSHITFVTNFSDEVRRRVAGQGK